MANSHLMSDTNIVNGFLFEIPINLMLSSSTFVEMLREKWNVKRILCTFWMFHAIFFPFHCFWWLLLLLIRFILHSVKCSIAFSFIRKTLQITIKIEGFIFPFVISLLDENFQQSISAIAHPAMPFALCFPFTAKIFIIFRSSSDKNKSFFRQFYWRANKIIFSLGLHSYEAGDSFMQANEIS